MTSTLIENLVERVSQKHSVLPHILFDEIALNLNERFHNYHVVDSLDEVDWAFCSEHFMYESFWERVTAEEKPEWVDEVKKEIKWYNKYLKQNNMKTKLEIGKEYWLSAQKISRGIYLGESNSGNFDFRITLGSKHTKPLGELDVMTSNLSVYSEYIPEKQWQFTTPIAMKCTEEQFNGIKDRLVEMGYKVVCMSNWNADSYLVNNLGNNLGNMSNVNSLSSCEFGRMIFESFNPDLFLALAAMTDKEDGIKGEYFKCVDSDDTAFGSLYIKTKENFSEMFRLDEKELVETGFDCASSSEFRKATAQEIIEHFEKKEFVLPEKWYVCPKTKENLAIILSDERYSGYKSFTISNVNNAYTSDFEYKTDKRYISSGYTEITTDQFKKYVLKETGQSSQIISIPPTKQATLFDDRVEIADWKPKEGDTIFGVYLSPNGITYEKYEYFPHMEGLFDTGFIKRTESEAKQLVEKLKQAML